MSGKFFRSASTPWKTAWLYPKSSLGPTAMTPTVVAPLPGAASDAAGADAPPPPLSSFDTAGLQAASTATTAAAIRAPAVRRIRMVILPVARRGGLVEGTGI